MRLFQQTILLPVITSLKKADIVYGGVLGMITEITGRPYSGYGDYQLPPRQQNQVSAQAGSLLPERPAVRDTLELSFGSDSPRITDGPLDRIIHRISRANLSLSEKERLVDYVWNAFKAASIQSGKKGGSSTPGDDFEKAINDLITIMEAHERYRLNLEELRQHIREINEKVQQLPERDKKEQELSAKLDKAAQDMKQANSSTEAEDRHAAVIEDTRNALKEHEEATQERTEEDIKER
jgi:hypothetical protein